MAAQPTTEDAGAPILVVDDSAGSRMAIRAMLAPLGHPVVEAGSGRDALRAVSARTFALILMDVRMPTMDGYETAKLMRERQQTERTPIIFVSAFGRDDMQTAAAYASGAVDFIFTPILPEVLRAKVSALVGLFLQAAGAAALGRVDHDAQRRAARQRGARPRRAAERRRRDRHRRRRTG